MLLGHPQFHENLFFLHCYDGPLVLLASLSPPAPHAHGIPFLCRCDEVEP